MTQPFHSEVSGQQKGKHASTQKDGPERSQEHDA